MKYEANVIEMRRRSTHFENAVGESLWFNSHIAANHNLIFSTKQYPSNPPNALSESV